MGIKRKASFTSSASPDSIASWNKSISSPSHTPRPLPSHFLQADYGSTDWASPEPYYAAGMSQEPVRHHMNTRTRKRFRDGRPDEETIHQNTLAKLYAGARQEAEDKSCTEDHMQIERANGMLTPSPSPISITRHNDQIIHAPRPKGAKFDIIILHEHTCA